MNILLLTITLKLNRFYKVNYFIDSVNTNRGIVETLIYIDKKSDLKYLLT